MSQGFFARSFRDTRRPRGGHPRHPKENTMSTPHVAQKAPYAAQRRSGQNLLLVRLRQVRQPTVLRRSAQGFGLRAHGLHRRKGWDCVSLRLQAQHQGALLRRLPQEPLKFRNRQARRPSRVVGAEVEGGRALDGRRARSATGLRPSAIRVRRVSAGRMAPGGRPSDRRRSLGRCLRSPLPEAGQDLTSDHVMSAARAGLAAGLQSKR